MRVTPLDIRKQEFRKVMRGLDTEEVYAFLQTVADEYEAVLSDNKNLRERMVELEDRLKEYKNIEMNLRNTLLTAEKITAEAKENARREASLIVREAEVEAEKAAEAIRAHTMQLRREILELKKQKDNYITRLKTLLDSHKKVLEGFEEDFSEVDRAIEKIGEQVEMDIKQAVTPPRMSREKITEDTVTGPSDKVTWDDERRREDESRPSMPKPDWHGKRESERDEAAPEEKAAEDHEARTPSAEMQGESPTVTVREDDTPETMQNEQPVATAEIQASPETAATDHAEHLNTEPVGAFEHNAEIKTVPDVQQSAPHAEDVGRVVRDEVRDGEARRLVEQSIAERLYPEAVIGDGGGTAPGSSPTAAMPYMRNVQQPHGHDGDDVSVRTQSTGQDGVGTAVAEMPVEQQTQPAMEELSHRTMPEAESAGAQVQSPAAEHVDQQHPEAAGQQPVDGAEQVEPPKAQDDWKHYEVQDQAPDWSDYDVPRPASDVAAQAVPPTDQEVEEALAGLKDISGNNQSPVAQPAEGVAHQPTDVHDPQPKSAAVPEAPRTPDAAAAPVPPGAPEVTAAPQAGAAPEPMPPREPAPPAWDKAPEEEEPTAETPPEDGEKKNSFWSMEQLRKNLSNFIGREEDQEPMKEPEE